MKILNKAFSLLIVTFTTVSQVYADSAKVAEKIRIGVSTTLTGDAASLGIDSKNALEFANDKLAGGRFEFVFEDDKCSGKDAVSVAHKLIDISKVKYVLGLTCNQSLLTAGPLYQKAGVTVITSAATSGDVTGLGDRIFRMFPADQYAAEAIFNHIHPRFKKIGILTEQNEFPELMERFVVRANKALAKPLSIETVQVAMGETELRSAITRFRGAQIEALFLNPGGEPGFIRAVQQMKQIGFHPVIYAAYYPGIKSVIDALGDDLNGIIYSDTQSFDDTLSPKGRELVEEFKKKYGEPVAMPLLVPIAIESLLVLQEALESGQPVHEYLRQRKFGKTIIGDFEFDSDGAIHGLDFRLYTVKNKQIEKFK